MSAQCGNRERGLGGTLGRHISGAGGGGGVDWFRSLLTARARIRHVDELRHWARRSAPSELYVIALDCSGSTLRGRRLGEAKGVMLELLASIYRRRARVGIVTFRGAGAETAYSGRRPPRHAEALIGALRGGGGTPLRAGVLETRLLLSRESKRFPAQRQQVMLFTDGRSRESIAGLEMGCPCILVDMESGPVRLGRSVGLAQAIGAEYIHMDALPIRSGAHVRQRRTS